MEDFHRKKAVELFFYYYYYLLSFIISFLTLILLYPPPTLQHTVIHLETFTLISLLFILVIEIYMLYEKREV